MFAYRWGETYNSKLFQQILIIAILNSKGIAPKDLFEIYYQIPRTFLDRGQFSRINFSDLKRVDHMKISILENFQTHFDSDV